MKVLAVIDSFKGSMTSLEAGQAAASGILRADPSAQVTVRALADGGEGTVEALTSNMSGRIRSVRVTGPLGDPVMCGYGIIDAASTAVIEMAGAAGLVLVPEEKRNPLYTTTYGVGEVIRDAIAQGCRRFIIGIGGSATNDGGIGLLIPLGFRFLDAEGKDIEPNGEGLAKLDKILPPQNKISTKFIVATDVENPLFGENGAAYKFALQKGAKKEDLPLLDANLRKLAQVSKKCFGTSAHDAQGAGSAGGCGYAMINFLDAKRVSGFDLFAKHTNLDARIKAADVVVTGEGIFDETSADGKGPYALAKLAAKYKKPVWIFCGNSDIDESGLAKMGLSNVKIGRLAPLAANQLEALNRAPKYLAQLTKDFVSAM